MTRACREEIIKHILPWVGDDRERAERWVREETIPGFGATAEELIEDGRGASVLRHLERIGDGGYA